MVVAVITNHNLTEKGGRPMTALIRNARPAWLIVFLGLMLSACQATLAPPFDQALVDDLGKADEQALALFTAVQDGSEASEFSKFAPRYETLIGKFGSLQNRADARPTPPLAKRLSDQLAKFEVLKAVCGSEEGDPGSCVNSSPSALKAIVGTLSKMRAVHKMSGLKKDIVALFKQDYDISIHQALTVEMALKRGPEPAN